MTSRDLEDVRAQIGVEMIQWSTSLRGTTSVCPDASARS